MGARLSTSSAPPHRSQHQRRITLCRQPTRRPYGEPSHARAPPRKELPHPRAGHPTPAAPLERPPSQRHPPQTQRRSTATPPHSCRPRAASRHRNNPPRPPITQHPLALPYSRRTHPPNTGTRRRARPPPRRRRQIRRREGNIFPARPHHNPPHRHRTPPTLTHHRAPRARRGAAPSAMGTLPHPRPLAIPLRRHRQCSCPLNDYFLLGVPPTLKRGGRRGYGLSVFLLMQKYRCGRAARPCALRLPHALCSVV